MRNVTLVDRSAGMLALAGRLGAASPWPALRGAAFREADLRSSPDLPPADLVIAAFSLGEIAEGDLATAVGHLASAASGLLLAVEPGTPAGFRRILDVRRLAVERGWHVAAPCPHDLACPLADGDWCHFAARFQRTGPEIRAARATRPFADEKFSYVALVREAPRQIGRRVIARPQLAKGQVRLRLCTPDGIRTEGASRRHVDGYRRLRQAEWGTWLDGT